MKRIFVKFLPIFVVFAASCSNEETPEVDDDQGKEIEETVEPLSSSLSAGESAQLANVSDFQYEYFKAVNARCAEAEGNMLCSPLSMQIALSMATLGVDDAPALEIAQTMGVDDLADVYGLYTKIVNKLPSVHSKTDVAIANSLWYDTQFTLFPDFVKNLSGKFGVEIFGRPFTANDVASEINDWCGKKTKGLVNEILLPGEQPLGTAMINALYFKSPWSKKFYSEDTKNRDFYGKNGTKSVPMMYAEGYFKVYKETDNDPVALQLSAGKNAYSVTFILPPANFPDIDAFIAAADFKSILSAMGKYEVIIHVPKFSLKGARMDLNDAIMAMGIEKLFEDGFTHLLKDVVIPVNLFQRCSLEIDENGAKAAAITNAGLATSPGAGELIRINRPFVVLIQEESTGLVLFAGKVTDL